METLPQLIEKARAGDLAAYERIVRRFQDMACGYAHSILGDFHLAEDVAQEAFVDAYQRLGDLREPGAFPGWLRRVVFKHCDRLTRRRGVSTVPLDAARGAAGDADIPDDSIEEQELSDRVLAAVRALPDSERQVATLYYINGYSQAEVAEFLEEPVTTVKSRLHTARQRLKERMMTMVKDVLSRNAPDDAFAERVSEVINVFMAKGPAGDLIGSPWEKRMRQQTTEVLRAGEEGFRIDVAMSESEHARIRSLAALHFGLRGDPRGKEHLIRLMADPSARVRNRAVQQYARLIHPGEIEVGWGWGLATLADKVPVGVEKLIPLVDDGNAKVRLAALLALGAYAKLGDSRIDEALKRGLADPIHKNRHYTARILGAPCPGCGAAAEK
ncbi:MAG: sigma-70 family RNA polymerase sigma factor [Planctomycetota bacterium]